MKIKTDEITSVIKNEIAGYAAELEVSEVGKVLEVGDGIARVAGLGNVMASELLEFESENGTVMGQAMNLEEDTVGAVIPVPVPADARLPSPLMVPATVIWLMISRA